MKKLLQLILTVIIVSMFVSCGKGNKIVFGVLTPLSGPAASSGIATKEGMDLAVEEINNSGGILGKKIELIYEDDGNNPKQAIAKVEKLLGKDEVKYLIGGLGSGVTIGIADTVKNYKPIMAWIGAASRLAEEKFADADWFFHYHPWEYYNIESTANFFKSTGAKTIAILYEDSAFGSGGVALAEPMFNEKGFKVVVKESFKSGSANFTPLLTKVKNTNPDILYVICYGADVIPLMNAVKELDVNPKLVYPVPPAWPEEFAKMPISEYVAQLNFWTPDFPYEGTKKFNETFKKKYGKDPNTYWQPLGYTNVISVAEAIKAAGSEEKDKVIQALAAQNLDTPFGKLTFKPSQKIKYQGFTQWLTTQFRNGKMEIVYPSEYKTADLVYPAPKWKDRK
jgi:branched-chain amino acid transport system substrate-binding protein